MLGKFYDGNPNNTPYDMSTEWKPWNKLNNNERFIVFDSVNDKGIAMFNTLSANSILQGISSESITVDQNAI